MEMSDEMKSPIEYEEFDPSKAVKATVEWIRNWFSENGAGCNAVIGISGGKDSSVVAALLKEALGKERVIGVLMPNGAQSDIDMARLLVDHLGIRNYTINIKEGFDGLTEELKRVLPEVGKDTLINLPARIRMSTLYAVAQSNNGRVANTCNRSEDYIGYSTKYGDAAGDFSPLANLLVHEVIQLGELIGVPERLTRKAPSDGLSGLTDEDKIGFTYATLDHYILTGECKDEEIRKKIDRMHRLNLHKLQLMPTFKFDNH